MNINDENMNNVKQKGFKLFAKFHNNYGKNKAVSYLEDTDGSLIIEGIASTTNKDLENDIINPSAIESMKKQATNINLLIDHEIDNSLNIIGAITEVIETDDNILKIKSKIRPKYSSEIKEMLDTGINLGFSISGDVTDYTENDDGGWNIDDITLFEISLTGMPANWDTYGTVTTSKGLVKSTCLTGACYQIMKNNNLKIKEGSKMVNNNDINNEASETLTKQDAIDLFNELTAQNNEQIKSDIIEEIKPQLEQLVEEKSNPQALNSELDNFETKDISTDEEDENSVSVEEGDEDEEIEKDSTSDVLNEIKQLLTELISDNTKSKEKDDEDDTSEEEVDKPKNKSLTEENLDSFAKSIEEKVLNNLVKNRNPELNRTQTKNIKTKENEEEPVTKSMSIKDIAKSIYGL